MKVTDCTSIIQPPKLWFVGKTDRVSEEDKGAVCHDVWMWALGPLTDPATKLELIPDIAIGEKPAHGLKVSGTIEPPITACFDAATHDLVRIDWKGKQFLFSHPVAVDGTRVPRSLLAEHPNVQFNYFRGGLGTCAVEMH